MIEIMDELAQFSSDPLGFVLFAFPWGEPGSELADDVGPESWQEGILHDLGAGLITYDAAIRLATTSGHGIGKSALVSWIILWALSTFEDTKGVVTANTETQLKTKTWAELAKWHRLFIGRDLFKATATALFSVDPAHEKTWRIDMVPWSERNTEAFAGMHNKGKRILFVMDEASAIPDLIWEVSEGALTDTGTQIVWAVFGNPTRNAGRFRECFAGGKFAHRWNSRVVDSRDVSFTDKRQIAEWVQDYGEDSDFVRVRVKGMFPRVDADSFIPYDLAREAAIRAPALSNDPIVLGVDVGRFGDDPSVIFPRRGRDAKTIPPVVMPGLDTQQVAARVAMLFHRLNAAMVFVDEGGVGAGVLDRLRALRIPVVGVDFGAKAEMNDPNDGVKCANRRAEIWARMRAWLRGGSIPERVSGVELSMVDELTAPRYGMNAREEIQLEAKKDMRRRGVKSPNLGDALACTFAMEVFESKTIDMSLFGENMVTPAFDPYSAEFMQ